MAKVDIGEKRTCPECDVKFYDLTRNPATCPKCGHSYDPAMVAATIPAAMQVMEDDDSSNDAPGKSASDEDDDDEVEVEDEARELELDGDDASLMAGGTDDGDDEGKTGRNPDLDGFSTDDEEEEDADAALVKDDDTLPPVADDDDDDDDAEEVKV